MLIVSQDKDAIINFDNIANLVVLENNIVSICNIEEKTGITIAEYETEERAKEVLQAIVKEYKKVLTTFNRGTGQQRFYDLPKAYYMPEK